MSPRTNRKAEQRAAGKPLGVSFSVPLYRPAYVAGDWYPERDIPPGFQRVLLPCPDEETCWKFCVVLNTELKCVISDVFTKIAAQVRALPATT